MDEEQIDAGEDIPIQQKKYRKQETSLKRMKEMYEARWSPRSDKYLMLCEENEANFD